MDFLIQQRDDLIESEKDIVKTIDEINHAAHTQFLSTFGKIRDNFIKVFRTLFDPGDEVDLKLEENSDPLAAPSEALARGEILLIFPEGSRGKPEQMTRFKSGVSRLTERNPDAPIVPVFMHGLGKSLPRGDFVVVPFFSSG